MKKIVVHYLRYLAITFFLIFAENIVKLVRFNYGNDASANNLLKIFTFFYIYSLFLSIYHCFMDSLFLFFFQVGSSFGLFGYRSS